MQYSRTGCSGRVLVLERRSSSFPQVFRSDDLVLIRGIGFLQWINMKRAFPHAGDAGVNGQPPQTVSVFVTERSVTGLSG